jgi:hypothetical protein
MTQRLKSSYADAIGCGSRGKGRRNSATTAAGVGCQTGRSRTEAR